MTYEFRCPTCQMTQEVERPMAQAADPGPVCCGSPTLRVYASAFHCDEIRGANYFHPDKRMEVRGHGSYFDLGLGTWITSKSQRRAEIKKRGYLEHGSKQV